MKLLVIASTHSEVQAVRNSRDLPGLAGFDQELRTLATRRRQSSATAAIKLPTGTWYLVRSVTGLLGDTKLT